jgi:hypothetical protein
MKQERSDLSDREILIKSENHGSIHPNLFEAFSVRPECRACAVYRGSERKTLTTNGLNQDFPKQLQWHELSRAVSANVRL